MNGHQLKPSQCGFEMTGALQSTLTTHYANTGIKMCWRMGPKYSYPYDFVYTSSVCKLDNLNLYVVEHDCYKKP